MTRLIDVKSFRMDGTGFHGFELFEISIPRKIKTRGSACKAYPFDNNRTLLDLFSSLSLRFVICQSHVTFVGYSEPTFHPFAFYPLLRIVTQLAGSRLGSGSRVSSSAFVSLPNLVNEQREGGKERRRRRSLVFVEHPSAPSR